jgi:hypothetical protein
VRPRAHSHILAERTQVAEAQQPVEHGTAAPQQSSDAGRRYRCGASHRRCEIFGRWRTQMGDWPALSMSANSARRRQCSVANGVPRCANSAFVWRTRVAGRASGWDETASRGRRYAQFVSRCVLQIGGCTVWRIAGGNEGVSNWHKGCLIRDQKRRALVAAIGGQR